MVASGIADAKRTSSETTRRAIDAVLISARFGSMLSGALAEAVHDPELVGNHQVLLLFDLTINGPRRPTDIQALTGLTSGGVTKLIDRLEAKGAIRRLAGHPDGDRRGVVVELTPAGAVVVERLAAGIEAHIGDIRGFANDLAKAAG